MLFLRATLSVTTPVEVDTIAIPSPFNTLGSSSALAYTRKPGFEILLIPLITLSPFEYLRVSLSFPCLLSSMYSTSLMKPSCFNISAICFFNI